ncbi:MAG: hypothetical protein JXR56_04890 [Candidatus Cloacimonetes bacterium]|nr:hypothetical protein [Candidatus Cloacimonadota bacterium]
MRFLKLLMCLLVCVFLVSCDLGFDSGFDINIFSNNPGPIVTDYHTIYNIETQTFHKITQSYNSRAYFVTDFENPENDVLLYNHRDGITLGDISGQAGSCDIEDAQLLAISHNRNRMVYKKDKDLYLANVNITGIINITNTPQTDFEATPSFTENDLMIVYAYNETEHNVLTPSIRTYNIETGNTEILFTNESTNSYMFSYPVLVNDMIIYLRSMNNSAPTMYFCDLDGENHITQPTINPIALAMNYKFNRLTYLAGSNGNNYLYAKDVSTGSVRSVSVYNSQGPILFSFDQDLILLTSLANRDSCTLYNAETLGKITIEGLFGTPHINKAGTKLIGLSYTVIDYNN